MVTMEQAREVWKWHEITDEELQEWVNLVNSREPEKDTEPLGETIEVPKEKTST